MKNIYFSFYYCVFGIGEFRFHTEQYNVFKFICSKIIVRYCLQNGKFQLYKIREMSIAPTMKTKYK